MIVVKKSSRALLVFLSSGRTRGYMFALLTVLFAAIAFPRLAAAQVLSAVAHQIPAGTNGTGRLIVYKMPGITRSRVTASTLLFVPSGKAPRGGWPIVAWAHGSTTPGFKQCAPSLSPDFDGGLTKSGLKSDYGFQITSLVNAGYAVVAPDFEGVGAAADSANPGFNSRSIANSLLFGMRAARKTDRTLSNQYITVGHSEGARALVAFDPIARGESDLKYRGSIALAPFTSMRALMAGFAQKRNALGAADAEPIVTLQNFIVGLVATGLKVETPTFDQREIMGSDLARVFPKLRELCAGPAIGAVTEAVKARGAQQFDGFKPGWADAPQMKRFLADNDPADMPRLTIKRPMLIVVGTKDDFVPAGPLGALVRRQQVAGAPITFLLEQEGDHFSIIKSAQTRVLDFAEQAFAMAKQAANR